MTMSVGLARIINDPEASVIVRKALGALSTPGLLVYDTGLSIDSTGRIVLKLKPDGGLLQGEDGMYLAPEDIVVGIDSNVELISQAYDRDWNARLTGSAPNYFESGLAIGSEYFGGVSAGVTAQGLTIEDAKVNITASTTQLRLSYNPSNYLAVRVLPSGFSEVFSVATSDPGFHFISGDGTESGISGGLRLNFGTTIEQIFGFRVNVNFAGGGAAGNISWVEFTTLSLSGFTVRPGQDHVTVCPVGGAAIPGEWLGFTARVSATDQLALRITWLGATAADNRDWLFLVHKLTA